MEVYFRKYWTKFGSQYMMLVNGKGEPICILEETQVKELIKEWKEEFEG